MSALVSAKQLTSENGRPRKLRCSGLRLSELAHEHHMSLDGRDGMVDLFTALSGLEGDGSHSRGIAVTYLSSTKFAADLPDRDDVAVITTARLRASLKPRNIPVIAEEDPHDLFYTAFTDAVENGVFEKLQKFVSPTAKVHNSAVLGENVHIEDGAVVEACAVILPNTYVGAGVVIKPNATVGGDGFENAVIRGRHTIVPHAGGVWLSEGAQVGSSTCIDRELFGGFSFVGPHTTIDNLVHFAHGAQTGRNCALVACAEISGGVVLGDGVWLGPNASINQLLKVGDHCYIGTGAVVTRDLPAYSLAYGSPAKVAAQVCECRSKIKFEANVATCDRCGKHYRLDEQGQVRRA